MCYHNYFVVEKLSLPEKELSKTDATVTNSLKLTTIDTEKINMLPRQRVEGACPCSSSGDDTNLETDAVIGDVSLEGRGEMPGQKCYNLERVNDARPVRVMDQGGLSALSWRSMTVRMIISQLTLKFVWDLLQLDPCKSMGLDVIHPRILRELSDVIAKPFVISEQSWEFGEIPTDWNW
ncbi:hypothetical protein BTVI_06585 [Pitangus sulphuratus]|nr:hypothetical protein BTVI_06585 [Pitangus sulphuratus]